ncbi:Pyridoxine/pyridoxal/pyridoxamine kinase [Xanthomonas sacchari]|uniref:pyridoxal kinase n=1 Tax=Xanthomonas TaxID=338 RepID=UPI00225833BF|nr:MULTISPECIES: pyridoxal kinase [Xanthomonas]MCW0392903.1 Pyridoxine/pyridoxal/pyridoxamine kinase [Xanthomonas sacchari]MCW0396828.1 Pyridoxine/pyridoxal/pyridoxamine kinase [Xanthomonas sacchari]MCW0446547.1 Pyridoxine/pyridoxal/pyridoxamine kinase [Xanthomonas sacchari]MCW0465982.1 Pyridoxine/pyridoxal/pyridoxamine kinase [Xanthomonas sacchari]MDY4342192.1 pyridoxal kinase [Xanthomonas sp. LF07-6]
MNASADSSAASHLIHGRRQRPDGPVPVDVISVQSQLVYGHAGNSAAVPPLRALGLRVAEIPTTLLSNAPFYATLRGKVLPSDWFADLLLGASERGLPQRARMLVSGYFGSVGNGAAFADWLDATLPQCPTLRYCLDPVIGDTHTGPYVEPGLEAIFAERLLPHAWLVTPNAFELGRLTGMPALAQDEAIAAARVLLARGPQWVLAHSVGGDAGQLVTLAVSREAVYRWCSPLLPVDVAGTGDVLMALLVAFLLRGDSFEAAIGCAIAGVHAALEATLAADVEELDVLAAAPAALATPLRFVAERLA